MRTALDVAALPRYSEVKRKACCDQDCDLDHTSRNVPLDAAHDEKLTYHRYFIRTGDILCPDETLLRPFRGVVVESHFHERKKNNGRRLTTRPSGARNVPRRMWGCDMHTKRGCDVHTRARAARRGGSSFAASRCSSRFLIASRVAHTHTQGAADRAAQARDAADRAPRARARRAPQGADQVRVEPPQVGRLDVEAVGVHQRLPLHRGLRDAAEDHPPGRSVDFCIS